MVQRSAPSDLVFMGISSVDLIFGYVMNVKFRKILVKLLDTDENCHVATACWR
jgi:hypothetical protein